MQIVRLLVKATDEHTFIALAEGDTLVELFIEPPTGSEPGSWVGRIVVGRVKTILPGGFAFVDVGAKKNAFMNLRPGHGLKAGDAVLVQVEKDATGTKGMYVGREITLRGRLVVVTKGHSPAVGVSNKITNEKEARRLRKIVRKNLPAGFGAIIRTNAQNATAESVADEVTTLSARLADIFARAEFLRPPAFPAQEASFFAGILSDLPAPDEIIIDAPEECFPREEITLPGVEVRYEKVSVKKQIRAALEKEVRLPCGGFITIERTEACVVIDVNTGGNVGKINYAQAVRDTNIEAARAIAAQIRLRNLSGIILADFIDMSSNDDKAAVLAALADAIKSDRIKVEIAGFAGLGMVLLTRRRTRPPIAEILQAPCEHCDGTGQRRV